MAIISVCSLLKTSCPRSKKYTFELYPYNHDFKICALDALKCYVDRTKKIRKNEDQLFISFCKPYHAVSKSTISRWIKNVLEESGIETEIFTRSAACAGYKRDGMEVSKILERAGR